MIDLIFVVENSVQWHESNMQMNPTHYSPIIPMSAGQIAHIQDDYGAGLWFHAYVDLPLKSLHPPYHSVIQSVKYGIINKTNFMCDLTSWKSLYIAGRLHKPMKVLRANDAYLPNLSSNLSFALSAALLLLPEKFREVDLYLTIASLSYIGDPRMLLGENPKKVCRFLSSSFRLPHTKIIYS